MSWFLDSLPGHEGALLGLLPCEDARRRADWYRELTPHDAELAKHGIFLDQVQVGCECGWRSPRMDAPIGACYWPSYVDAPEWFTDQARTIWRAHAIATEFAKQEAASVRAER